jgi:asparagine synthetase B (glutamine-hydrolysing)
MCTFKITNDSTELFIDQYLKSGGPTESRTIELDGIYITHHLLNITGEITPQPIYYGGKYFMLIGEFYNYDDSWPSDIHFGIEKYNEYGDKFTEHLDGEFLFIVIDERKIHFFTDPFSTKQAYYFEDGDNFYFTSLINKTPDLFKYFKNLEGHYRLPANSHVIFDVDTKEFDIVNENLHKWNLEQNSDDLDNVILSFEGAVNKRWYHNSTLFMSGGVDSLAVACCLAKNKKHFNAITSIVKAGENQTAIDKVVEYCGDYINHTYVTEEHMRDKNYYPTQQHTVSSELRKLALSFGSKVILMGSGSDETIDMYRSKTNSDFDLWPENQNKIFPYRRLYEDKRELYGYINSIDYHYTYCCFFGQEVRSVFYDKQLAQDWLNMKPHYKNIEYKHITKEYLRKCSIFEWSNPDVGFGFQGNLQSNRKRYK